jgi:hypothetical protein
MAQDLVNNDLHINGSLSAKTFTPPAGCIDNAAIKAAADIDYTKLEHMWSLEYDQPGGTAMGADTRYLHTVRGATAVVLTLEAFVDTVATGADRTVTLDLKKSTGGGAFASILAATLVFNNTDTARTHKTATISAPTLVDGDKLQLTVAVAGSAGNQAQGLGVTITIKEKAQ